MWGVVKEGSLFSANSCEGTLGPGPSLAGQLCSSVVCYISCLSALCYAGLLLPFCVRLVCFAPGRHLWCFCSAREMHSSVFSGKWKVEVSSTAKGEVAYVDRSPWPRPLIGLALICMRTLNPGSLIGPKDTVLDGQNRATLVGQNCAALIGWEKP